MTDERDDNRVDAHPCPGPDAPRDQHGADCPISTTATSMQHEAAPDVLTAEALAELQRLLGAVESTPWRVPERDLSSVVDGEGWCVASCTYSEPGGPGEQDAALIAAAVNALPALLDAAAERDNLRKQVAAMADPDRLSIMYGWLVWATGEHTCGGYGPGSGYAHEPGCGYEPILDLSRMEGWPGAERDALAATVERVRALPAKHPAGGWYMISMRDVLAALDEETDHE